MDLIPIVKSKIEKDKWLNTPIQYENEFCIKDVIEILCQKTYAWMNSKNDFEVITDYESFKKDYINLVYSKYLHE
tara:strand:+ start:194 stop:418 length:225 start_codon:yes stop_codon:yes gene_type:complete